MFVTEQTGSLRVIRNGQFLGQYARRYFFADYVAGWIYRMPTVDESAAVPTARTGANPTGLVVASGGARYVLIGNRIDRIAP